MLNHSRGVQLLFHLWPRLTNHNGVRYNNNNNISSSSSSSSSNNNKNKKFAPLQRVLIQHQVVDVRNCSTSLVVKVMPHARAGIPTCGLSPYVKHVYHLYRYPTDQSSRSQPLHSAMRKHNNNNGKDNTTTTTTTTITTTTAKSSP